MLISYLIPTHQYGFFDELVDPLLDHGFDVIVNSIPDSTDLILAGILPVTHQWIEPIVNSGKPYILWHWDLFSFVDYREPRWESFLRMLHSAADIWSCSYETARQLKEKLDLDSAMVPAWTNLTPDSTTINDFVFYASSSGAFGKRLDWAQRACALLGLPLDLTTGQNLPRPEYLYRLRSCRVYLMTAFEESNGTIPAMEAVAVGRPIVCADIPSNREVFGEDAYYFHNYDFADLLRAIGEAWFDGPKSNGSRVRKLFGLSNVACIAARQLRSTYAEQQTRSR